MTHEPTQDAANSADALTRLKNAQRAVRNTIRTLQVRLRFIVILAAALVVAGQWDTLRNHWDKLTSRLIGDRLPSRIVPPDTEYFCPMDPVVVSMTPGKCDICNMALVRRKIGDTSPLPSGVLARMQLSPYRMQLAGIQTAPADYRPIAHELHLTGIARKDGQIECRVSARDRAFVAAGQAAEVCVDESSGQAKAKGQVTSLDVNPHDSHTNVAIHLEESAPVIAFGTNVFATVHKPIAELEPFRSLPTNAPPLVKGELLALYTCPQHPEVFATARGRCPVDRNNELQRRGLLDNQRVRWWCPMHPNVTSDQADASCAACGEMKLVPRIVTYRPTGKVLTVPESAVVDTGTRKVVFVEQMPGMFDSIEISVGPRCGDVYPVVSGIEPGQRVVVNGAFLLDAETRLNPGLAASYFGAGRSARDELPVSKQGTCPVTGKPLGSMGTPVSITINGQTVQLCCEGCEERLRKSPEKYLSRPKSR